MRKRSDSVLGQSILPIYTSTPAQDVPASKIPRSAMALRAITRWCRPRLQPNHTRLEWQCCCGEEFWGDHRNELGVHGLASELEQDRYRVNTVTTHTTSASRQTGQLSSAALRYAPTTNTPPRISAQTACLDPSDLSALGKAVFLELCIPIDFLAHKLVEIEIIDSMGRKLIDTDVELFASIRKAYDSTKYKGFFAFLCRPVGIQFVEFSCRENQIVTIHGDPSIPSIPPPVEVELQQYHYYRCPLDRPPPMDQSTFLQYFRKHWSCSSQSTRFINRLPKKLGASLTIHTYNNHYDANFGWGIYLKVGPNAKVLSGITFVVLAASMALAITYNKKTGQHGDGWTMASWVSANLGALVASLYYHIPGH